MFLSTPTLVEISTDSHEFEDEVEVVVVPEVFVHGDDVVVFEEGVDFNFSKDVRFEVGFFDEFFRDDLQCEKHAC
jgi:hypothetical protein